MQKFNAFTAVYLILATTTTNAIVQQSFLKPSKWEPQINLIELKCIREDHWSGVRL